MRGEKFDIAKGVAKTVINTLTKQDYVNVICARLISGSLICYFSESMRGEKFDIAKGVAKTVINTLTKQDYVNVICARASYWDEVGKYVFTQLQFMYNIGFHLVCKTIIA